MFEFRILSDDDLYQQQELMQYAFNPGENNYKDLSVEEYNKYFKPVTFFGLFDEQLLVSTLIIISFQQRVRGVALPMAGIAGVATKPEYRRMGLVKKLFDETYIYCKNNNIPISLLFPFKVSYYEQFGYAWVENLTRITGWINDERAIERMKPLYKKFYLTTNGLINREVTTNAFQKRLDKGFFFFSVDEQDNDTGYLAIWYIEDDTLGIRELIAPDIKTRKNLWNFIRLHEGHKRYFKISDYVPHEVQTYPYIKEPRVKKIEILPSAMLRIIDVQETLSKIKYNDNTESLVMAVKDPLCEWNNKTWRLSIEHGKGTVTESENLSPEVEIDIKGLAQLLSGFRNTIELEEQEWIKGTKESFKKIDRIFSKDHFIVRDFF